VQADVSQDANIILTKVSGLGVSFMLILMLSDRWSAIKKLFFVITGRAADVGAQLRRCLCSAA